MKFRSGLLITVILSIAAMAGIFMPACSDDLKGTQISDADTDTDSDADSDGVAFLVVHLSDVFNIFNRW